MKTAEEIYKSHDDYYMANYMEMGVNHRSAIIGAMQEYASQFQAQLSEKDREIEGLRLELVNKQNRAVYFAEWISDNGWIRDPFPRREFNDEVLRYTNISEIDKDSDEELKIHTIEELYKMFINRNEQPQPGYSGTKQDKR